MRDGVQTGFNVYPERVSYFDNPVSKGKEAWLKDQNLTGCLNPCIVTSRQGHILLVIERITVVISKLSLGCFYDELTLTQRTRLK